MRSMYRSGTRLEFESISWMLMAHCRIANQGRSSLSTASILTPLDPSRRRSHDMKSDKWWLGTISCIYDMQWFMPCTTCNLHAPIRMLKKSLENRLRITVRFEKNIWPIVRNSPKTDVNVQNSFKFRIPAAYHGVAIKTPFNTSEEALSFLLQLLDRSFFRINASGLRRHCGVTLVAPSGNWVFSEGLLPLWQKLNGKNAKNMHHVNLFPCCTGRLPSLKQPKPLPARRLQPRCSGMFFRWAGIQRPDSQILAIHANRVQELKENNGLIGYSIGTE